MTTRKHILMLLVALCISLPIAFTGCSEGNTHKVDIERLKAELARTGSERDSWKRKVDSVTNERDRLKGKVDELIESRGELEKQINGLVSARDTIKKQFGDLTASSSQWQDQVDELTRAKNEALATAKDAQAQMDGLKNQLQASTQRVTQLETQFKQVQAAVKDLQEKTNF